MVKTVNVIMVISPCLVLAGLLTHGDNYSDATVMFQMVENHH